MCRLLLAPVVGTVLLLAAGAPGAVLGDVQRGDPGTAPAALLVAVAALLAWAALVWLLLIGLLTCGSELRGRLGRLSAAMLCRAAPAALRRTVALALGAGLALGVGPVGLSAADAAPVAAAAPAAPDATSPALDWPGLVAAPTPVPAAPAPARPTGAVVVRAGDSLWSLAAARLPPGAPARDVAAAWPTWWAANRAVIGADPDVLRPGQSLAPPGHDGAATTEQP